MPFASTHLYITARWEVAGLEEEGQFGLRVNQSALPTAGEQASVAGFIQAAWNDALADISPSFLLYEVKSALIGQDGLYVPGVDPVVTTIDPPDGGGGSGALLPLQIACVGTLRTAKSRGYASRGRIYLPAIENTISSGFVWGTTEAQNRATVLSTMIGGINTTLAGQVCVMSSVGAGAVEPVTRVEVGRRPDVQRRRAKSVVEAYEGSDVP